MNQENKDLSKTQIWQPADNQNNVPKPEHKSQSNDLNKTQIWTDKNLDNNTPHAAPINQPKPTHARKLVGWLASFTTNPNGEDFRLYEGRNTIGSNKELDIAISDAAVSTHHLTILHRMGGFKFKDELSTNGTFINGFFAEEGMLADGDKIKIGNTEFVFKSIH